MIGFALAESLALGEMPSRMLRSISADARFRDYPVGRRSSPGNSGEPQGSPCAGKAGSPTMSWF